MTSKSKIVAIVCNTKKILHFFGGKKKIFHLSLVCIKVLFNKFQQKHFVYKLF